VTELPRIAVMVTIMPSSAGGGAVVATGALEDENGAPISIHFLKSASTDAESRSRGGICKSSSAYVIET